MLRKITFNKKRKGSSNRLICRTDTKAIVELSYDGSSPVGYDVVRIKRRPLAEGSIINDSLIADGYTDSEVFPSDSEWGSFGWSYDSMQMALDKYSRLP